MDPIKVDFSKKERGKKDVVIPPERAGLKIVLSLVLTLVFALIAFYVMLPALNPKSFDLYLYLGLVAASYVVFNALFVRLNSKPEYVPYVKRRALVPGILIGVLAVAVLTERLSMHTPRKRKSLWGKTLILSNLSRPRGQ